MQSVLTLSADWLTTVLLLSLRLAAVFLLTPLFAAASVPTLVRILLVLGLSMVLTFALPAVNSEPVPHMPSALFQAAFCELILGATLGLGILMAFSAFSIAGNLLDIQIGFGLGQVIDPTSNTNLPILTALFNQIAVLCFFLLNGHHALLHGVAYSLERFPLGENWFLSSASVPLIRQIAGLFSLGFALVAPIVLGILMVEMALGVIVRSMPQMNMFSIGVPVKIVVGLAALAIWFAGIGDVMPRIYASIYRTWSEIFAKGESDPKSESNPFKQTVAICAIHCKPLGSSHHV